MSSAVEMTGVTPNGCVQAPVVLDHDNNVNDEVGATTNFVVAHSRRSRSRLCASSRHVDERTTRAFVLQTTAASRWSSELRTAENAAAVDGTAAPALFGWSMPLGPQLVCRIRLYRHRCHHCTHKMHGVQYSGRCQRSLMMHPA